MLIRGSICAVFIGLVSLASAQAPTAPPKLDLRGDRFDRARQWHDRAQCGSHAFVECADATGVSRGGYSACAVGGFCARIGNHGRYGCVRVDSSTSAPC